MEAHLKEAVAYHYGAFPPENLRFQELLDPVFETGNALSRYDQMLAAMHNSEILLAPLRNQEAVISSRMEGTISTLDEILRIEAEESEASEETFRQARSEAVETFLYTRALQRVQREIEAGRPLSEAMIKQAHQILLSFGRGATKSPGAYKTEQNYIGERRRSVSFVPINPIALPQGMENLFSFITTSKTNPLLKTALAHVEFEALHPFKDGNGRIGRMLITLMLWTSGLIKQPHFYVSAYFERYRDDYIDMMRRVSSDAEWTEWCVFFLNGLREQAERNIIVAQKIFDLYSAMKLRFREELKSEWATDALDFMFANPSFKNSKFTSHDRIPPHVAASMTRKLRETGLLSQIVPGSGRRPAIYGFKPLIDIVRHETEE
ncbi:Fic family protein [Pseudogemmobacter blasticus]|uniref:Cell filamentation protein Fic n=1 Tax=Fuscovulum blasticum DSM 2131 TaxID=1188250 RepID=A0A2T4J9M9_FUSBL|nr:Fic family protein [Fuscovulum blasticum]PTE14616.1 cell filamentation protein Fic [Fuscovulum blasticum DSM 2131]